MTFFLEQKKNRRFIRSQKLAEDKSLQLPFSYSDNSSLFLSKSANSRPERKKQANIFRNSIIHFLFPYELAFVWRGNDQRENEIKIV